MNPEILNILKGGETAAIKNLVESLPPPQLQEIRAELDDVYYNSDSQLISDHQYDIFYEALIATHPGERKKVGTRVREKNIKVVLPYWMGSLDKKKDQKTISRWEEAATGTTDFLISEKLDGLSLLLEYKKGVVKLYTRGDGKVGSDVSHLYHHLNLPLRNLDKTAIYAIRGELIISREKFKRYQEEYDNPRQMVAGIVNAHTLKPGIEVIDFVAYQIMNSAAPGGHQYLELQRLGFEVPQNVIETTIDAERLKILLQEMGASSKYCIDGLVVTRNDFYIPNTSGNPENSWAFKVTGRSYQTVVEEVIWNISKSGILKPSIRVKPTEMVDITVSMVTGFNARYIRDNGIGKGSVIKIVRSGDVIPHIVEIIKAVAPHFPRDIRYKWNSTGVDIMPDDILENKEVGREYGIKRLSSFCAGLGIPNLGHSTVSKLYKAGWDTMDKLLDCKQDSFENIKGLGKKSSERIYLAIHQTIPSIGLSRFVAASGELGAGIGEKKINSILEKYHDIFHKGGRTPPEYVRMLATIPGFGGKTTEKFVENIGGVTALVGHYDKFFKWTDKTRGEQIEQIEQIEKIEKSKDLEGYNFVFTGFRDRGLADSVTILGGQVADRITKSTTHLVVRGAAAKSTTKVKLAEENGIEIVYLDWLEALVCKKSK